MVFTRRLGAFFLRLQRVQPPAAGVCFASRPPLCHCEGLLGRFLLTQQRCAPLRSFSLARPLLALPPPQDDPKEPEPEKNLTIYQRFKETYKTHGKILVGVHVVTSVCWFGGFFAIVHSGIDVISFLEWLNVSEKLLGPVRSSAWVDFALAYLMYKLASPARYMATIGGTQLVVSRFRRTGRIPTLRDEDRLRNLAKEGQASIKEIAKDKREDLSQRYQNSRENLREAAKQRLNRRARRKGRSKDPE